MSYDSTKDTRDHIAKVVGNGVRFCLKLQRQIQKHDASKLKSPEKEGFDIYTPKLAQMTYGSDEYKQCLKDLSKYLEHHYANNSHHPEHFENGIAGMNLYDLVEMYCDWQAAVKRHADGDIRKSIEINKKRFGMSEQLASIFLNTAEADEEPSKITGMAYNREKIKQRIKAQTKNIVSWWCLLDYFKKYEDINNLTQHEQGKLGGTLHTLAKDKVKDSDSEEVKIKILNDYWKDTLELHDNPETVVNMFWDKFNKECIKCDYDKFDEIGRDFNKDIDIVISLIASGTRSSIDTYLREKFGIHYFG